MGKKKDETKSGEEIQHVSESLSDSVSDYFSRMEQFIDVMEMVDLKKIPGQSFDGFQFFMADLGRTLINDMEKKFETLYDFVIKEVGDIQIDSTGYLQEGIEGGKFLKAYIKKNSAASPAGE